MEQLHASYIPISCMEVTLESGQAIILAAVSGLSNHFCTKMPDGSFVSFDVREIAVLSNAFDGVSRGWKARLEALAHVVHSQFHAPGDFYAVLVGASTKMASNPASHLQ